MNDSNSGFPLLHNLSNDSRTGCYMSAISLHTTSVALVSLTWSGLPMALLTCTTRSLHCTRAVAACATVHGPKCESILWSTVSSSSTAAYQPTWRSGSDLTSGWHMVLPGLDNFLGRGTLTAWLWIWVWNLPASFVFLGFFFFLFFLFNTVAMLTVTGGPLLPVWQKRGREEQVRGPHPRCPLPVLFGDLESASVRFGRFSNISPALCFEDNSDRIWGRRRRCRFGLRSFLPPFFACSSYRADCMTFISPVKRIKGEHIEELWGDLSSSLQCLWVVWKSRWPSWALRL